MSQGQRILVCRVDQLGTDQDPEYRAFFRHSNHETELPVLALGLTIHYVWQFLAEDTQNEFLFPFNGYVEVDMPLLKKIMDAHETHILWEAERLEAIGVGAISADWSAMWLCFHCGIDKPSNTQEETDELKDYYMERMGIIIDKIKEKFTGKVYVGENVTWNDKRVFDKVDGVLLSFGDLFNKIFA